MGGQVNWPGTEVTQQPQAQQPGVPTLTQVVPPTSQIPQGYRPAAGGLAPISGGPADPANQPPSGYRYRADRTLEAIPGGPADPSRNATGATDDPGIRSQAQALVEGRIPWPTARAATDPHWQQIVATAFQLDPNLDETAHARRRAAVTQFTGNGSAAQVIGSAGRLANHLNDLNQASEELAGPNVGERHINSLLAYGGQSFQPTAYRTYNTAVEHVSQELMRYFRGGRGGSLAEIQQAIGDLSPSQSLDERRAAIREVISLIGGAVQPLQQQYNDAFAPGSPRPHLTWLSPRERQIYSDLGGVDFNLDGDNDPQTAAALGTPPTVGGAPQPGGGSPPQGGTPATLLSPTQGSAPGVIAATSDTPPEHAVSQHYLEAARQLQDLFDHGATPQEIEALNQRLGYAPLGPDLVHATQYRDRGGRGARIIPPETLTPAGERAQQLEATQGAPGYGQRARAGWTQGLNDEISGVASSLGNALAAPFTGNFDPVGQYQVGRDAERIRDADAQAATGAPGTALEVGTGIIGSAPAFVISGPAEATTLGGRMVSGARTGATVGAGEGWAHGEGLGGSVRGAVVGAAEGAPLGAAAPVAGVAARAGGRFVRGAYRMARSVGDSDAPSVLEANPEAAHRIIAQTIAADDARGTNPIARVSGQLADAHAHGVPAMLADTGENARDLLASASRLAGPTKTAARDALDARQAGMADRVTGAIERDLGPVANPHEVADQLMTRARDTAGPLYDEAYARPGADAFAQRIAPLLQRPGMQDALRRAERIAAEEGRDPNTTGFDVNSSGEITVSRTPSWQTLDYVKRGLDDVISGLPRNPATGEPILDTANRAINNTRKAFLQAFDQANPVYGRARAAYGGPVSGIDAMNTGMRFLNMTADDVEAQMRHMTPYERQMAQLGTRRAMAEHVASRGDTADVVNALVGTGKKRAMLARLFGSRQDFQRFVDTLGHEQEAFRTYRGARLGSQTAANIQNDNAFRDAATEGAADVVLNGGTGILPSAVKFVTRLGRRSMDEQTAKQITALLSESDPARLRELATELRQEQTRQAVARARQARNARVGGAVAGETVGGRQR